MVDAIEIGYAIKDRRAELGLTQAQLAEAAGVSKRCLWSLELGRNPGVQLDKLTAVLRALDLDLVISTTDAAEATAHQETDARPRAAMHEKANAYQKTDVTGNDAHSASRAAADAPPGAAANGEDFVIDAVAILTGGQQ